MTWSKNPSSRKSQKRVRSPRQMKTKWAMKSPRRSRLPGRRPKSRPREKKMPLSSRKNWRRLWRVMKPSWSDWGIIHSFRVRRMNLENEIRRVRWRQLELRRKMRQNEKKGQKNKMGYPWDISFSSPLTMNCLPQRNQSISSPSMTRTSMMNDWCFNKRIPFLGTMCKRRWTNKSNSTRTR